MTLHGLIQDVYSSVPKVEEFNKIALENHATVSELLDSIARDVAIGYMNNIYSWQFCDVVMNNLFSFVSACLRIEIPEFTFKVYVAFDEGEYLKKPGKNILNGEPLTKSLLVQLLQRQNA